MLNDELSENMCGLFYCVVEDDVNDAVTVLNKILSHAGDNDEGDKETGLCSC